MSYEVLKSGDGRRHSLLGYWEKWLRKADDLYGRFLERTGDSPFLYHEVASVGFLAAAAAMAGFIPLAEYEIIKKGHDDKRARVDGQADFWFASDDRAYSFEPSGRWSRRPRPTSRRCWATRAATSPASSATNTTMRRAA